MKLERASGILLHPTSLPGGLLDEHAYRFVDWLAAVLAFVMEPEEDKQLTWLIFIQRFAYRQVFSIVLFKTLIRAFQGRPFAWDKLERTAAVNYVPAERKDSVNVP